MSNKSVQSKIIDAIQSVDQELHNNHPLKNKYITILGDCFSAYTARTGTITGWTAYPNYGYTDVKSVEGMWWHKMMSDTGAKPCKILASPDWDVNQWSRYSSSWWIKAGETYTDLDGVQHEGPTQAIYPDIVIIMAGGNYLKVITEVGTSTAAAYYQNVPGLPDEFTYDKYCSSNGTGNYTSWKGYLNRVITDIEGVMATQKKHIDIYICDPTCFNYYTTSSLSYDPYKDTRKYKLGQIIDMVCEFWGVKRIPTSSFFRGGLYGAGIDTFAVSGGTATTYYLPNINGMCRIAKGIENYMEYLPYYKPVEGATGEAGTINSGYDESVDSNASSYGYVEYTIDLDANEGDGTDTTTINDVEAVADEEEDTGN